MSPIREPSDHDAFRPITEVVLDVQSIQEGGFIVIGAIPRVALASWENCFTDLAGIGWGTLRIHLALDHPDRLRLPRFLESIVETVRNPRIALRSESQHDLVNLVGPYDLAHDMVVSVVISSTPEMNNGVVSARIQRRSQLFKRRYENLIVWKRE
ncbi:MAG: hypothetical protein IT334_07560 [Thermomicrobiales bacterium]|nr:hypothetical protein [Thermomicrobiales bacterium]